MQSPEGLGMMLNTFICADTSVYKDMYLVYKIVNVHTDQHAQCVRSQLLQHNGISWLVPLKHLQ